LIGTILVLIASAAAYAIHAARTPGGPRGDSWLGLTLGVAAALMILYAGFLGLRKKVLLLRIGTVTWWMRGHLWLGALALPLALMHGAFSFGGPLTTVLMWLLIVVVVSGIVGAMLQHALPGMMTAQVQREHTHEQAEQIRWSLRREAYELVAAACGSVEQASHERAALETFSGHAPREPKKTTPVEGQETFAALYVQRVLPYLRGEENGVSPLREDTTSALVFDGVRSLLDPSLHGSLDDLASICDEARQQVRQSRLHWWLHAWLLVHVPLSMALLVLMLVHAAMALYY
jgi:hypothetical protein